MTTHPDASVNMMTKREEFASRIMAGFAASPEEQLDDDVNDIANAAVRWVDALIDSLNRPKVEKTDMDLDDCCKPIPVRPSIPDCPDVDPTKPIPVNLLVCYLIMLAGGQYVCRHRYRTVPDFTMKSLLGMESDLIEMEQGIWSANKLHYVVITSVTRLDG